VALEGRALGEEDLEEGLIRDVAAVRQDFEIRDHGGREAQRDRLERGFELNEILALGGSRQLGHR